MKIELGAKVATAEGDEIGTIDKLILDPDGGDIHAIVVHKGLLFGRDIEIPVDEIAGIRGGVARIRHTKADLDALPTFYEGSYTTPRRSAAPSTSAATATRPPACSGPRSGAARSRASRTAMTPSAPSRTRSPRCTASRISATR